MMVQLGELMQDLVMVDAEKRSDLTITGVTADSRAVQPGYLFICLPGVKTDGHLFARQAVEQGAVALLVEKEVPVVNVVTIRVPSVREAMPLVVGRFYDYPSRKLRMVGITGTNGKTTTIHLVKAILENAGRRTGLLGTIGAVVGSREIPAKNTTPDVVDLQGLLHLMVQEHLSHAVMEVSSHALDMGRVRGCEYDIAVFTNVTRDHLDYHKTFANYIHAKAELFRMVSMAGVKHGPKAAVVNVDDPAAKEMIAVSKVKVLRYGIHQPADIYADAIDITETGTSFVLHTPVGTTPVKLKLTGLFNVYNVLAAVGVGLAEEVSLAVIVQALEEFSVVPGRFELIRAGQQFAVIVDYAHTPDGLENVLRTAREIGRGKLIVVFGCGGDRDRVKRPMMGKLAAELADVVVVTSDNPRSEEPVSIIEEIEQGIGQTSCRSYVKIPDRRQAIAHAIQQAGAGDIVLIAGKGHETYQILGDTTIHFDDREVAREVIREMKH